jgi:hypothetical protein
MSRERRLNGNDRCEHGHGYPSVSALASAVSADLTVLVAEVERLRADVERLQQMQPKRDYYASLGAAQERAAVGAALERWAEDGGDPWMSFCADRIKSGEHRREETE